MGENNMTENERRILVEWMELVNKYIYLVNPIQINGAISLKEWINDFGRMQEIAAQLRDADKPAGGPATPKATPGQREGLGNKFLKYPVRRCYTRHECAICNEAITLGQVYYDGGYGKRAHLACAEWNSTPIGMTDEEWKVKKLENKQ